MDDAKKNLDSKLVRVLEASLSPEARDFMRQINAVLAGTSKTIAVDHFPEAVANEIIGALVQRMSFMYLMHVDAPKKERAHNLKKGRKKSSEEKRADAKAALRGLRTLKPSDAIKQLAENGKFSRSLLYDVASEMKWIKKRKSTDGR